MRKRVGNGGVSGLDRKDRTFRKLYCMLQGVINSLKLGGRFVYVAVI